LWHLVKLNKTVLFQWSATLVSTRNSGLTCLTSFLEHLLVSVVRPNAVASFLTSGCSIDLPNEDNVPKCLNSTTIYDNQPTITVLYSSCLPSPSLLILLNLQILTTTLLSDVYYHKENVLLFLSVFYKTYNINLNHRPKGYHTACQY